MTGRRLRLVYRNQRGFSLIELVIVIAIAGMIASAVTMTIFQVFDINARSSAHMTAVKQVENAIHWMSRDIRMAQDVDPGLSEDSGFPLKLTWVEWEDKTVNEVTYSIENDNLVRSHSAGGGLTETIVAQHIDSEMTSVEPINSGLELKITATVTGVGTSSETRVVEVVSRPSA